MPRDGDIDGRLAHGNLLRRWIARLPGRAGGWLALMGGIALAVGSAALVRWGESPGMFGGIAGFMLAGALIAIAWEREFGGRYAIGRRLDVLRGAFEALRTPRVILSSDREIVYVNRAFRSQFPISAGGTLHDIEAHLGAEGRWLAEFERVCDSAAEGVAGQAEVSTASSEGRSRWFNLEASPLFGSPGYVILRIEDITSRREMEQIIREEQDKLVDFLENAPIGFYSVDGEGRFLFVNRTLAEWLGTTPEDILSGGQRLADFVVDRPPGTPAHDPFGRRSGGDGAGEVTLRGLQDSTFQANISQSVVSSEREGGLRTRSVVRDLTPEREWEEALRRSEQQFQRIFEDAPVGIALLDTDGNVAQSNRALRNMLGMPDTTSGLNLLDFVQDGERSEIEADVEALGGSDGVSGRTLEIHPKRSSETVISLYLDRLTDPDGRVSGIIIHGLDTTEQRNLEVQFAQSQKMQAVGQLAGGVAHDFNNLLTAMIGFCDLLLLRHKPGEQSFGDIMQIKQNANRAANLVRQLLAFSRQQTMKPKVLNITDVLAELAHLLRRLLGDTIRLKLSHGRDLGLVRVDQGQLEQVIINLVVNARDAMTGDGTVEIRTSNVSHSGPQQLGHEMLPPGDYVLLEVIDEGVGIPKENLGRIFEPFFSTKEVGSGTGLGLSTVYGIVKQTGGYIFVESEPGKGATFLIFLPRHGEEVGDATAAARDADAGRDLTGAGTVLLVEDEDPVRLFSARALRNKGYTVLEAASGEAALEVIGKGGANIDLLITDVVMPRMDGPSLIREVRETIPDIKIICISGYAEDAFRKKLDRSADIHFLPKPFSLNQLAGKVKEVMNA